MDTKINWFAVVAASLGGLLFGFDTVVFSGVTKDITQVFGLTGQGLGEAAASALVGTLVGALVGGQLGDRFGSRTVLLLISMFYVVSAVGSGLSNDLTGFMAFRFLGGLAIGGSSVLAPVYIAEISPATRRGRMVGQFQINVVVGILLAYVSNLIVGHFVPAADLIWRVKLAVAAVPATVFLAMVLAIPESPRWLLAHDRKREAERAIARLHLGDPATVAAEFGGAHDEGRAKLSWAAHKRSIILAVTLGVFSQLTGINAVLYFLNAIFAAAGFTTLSADVQSVAVGATNLLATLVGMSLIDRWGRTQLLKIGGYLMALALLGVAVIYSTGRASWLLLPMLMFFVASFAVSMGTVIWVYITEIFPTAVRSRGQSLGSAANWATAAVISYLLPQIFEYSYAIPFWFFAAMMLVQGALVVRFCPETKGVRLEDMETRMV